MMKLWKWIAIGILVLLVAAGSGLGYSLARTVGELDNTKTNLTTTQADLASTRNKLTDTQDTLVGTQNELKSTKDILAETQDDLQTTQNSLTDTRTDLRNSILELSKSEAQAVDYSQKLADIQFQYNNLSKGYSYITNNVSYQTVKNFLNKDQTDTHIYNIVTYNCFNFTADVIYNATAQHIRCGFVYILFTGGIAAHAIVAFSTTDTDVVFVEPQSDQIAKLQIGKHYWSECLPPGHLAATDFDDTIESFVIIW
jgi:hypothetical protein